MQKGALYIRVSTDMQTELSPEAQKRLMMEYAQRNKIYIDDEHIFYDEGRTGRKTKHRTEFLRMISIAKSKPKPFDVVLVHKFSRFARSQEDSIVYKNLLKKDCNIQVISISEPIIEGPYGELIERIIEWMDEYYSINLGGEVIKGMTQKALQGGYQGKIAFGYQSQPNAGTPTVIPEESKIVKTIFDMYVNQHKGEFQIARYLNNSGYKTRSNKTFSKRSISYILQNPFYYGIIRWNYTYGGSNEKKETDEIIISKGSHLPLITKDTFDKAQQIRNSRPKGRKRPPTTYKHWLSGLLRCSHCGSSLNGKVLKRTSGEHYVYYRCNAYTHGKCDTTSAISSLILEPFMIEQLKKISEGSQTTFKYKSKTLENDNELNYLESKYKKLEEKEKRIRMAFIDGIDSSEDYKINKDLLNKEREQLSGAIEEARRLYNPSKSNRAMLEKIQSAYEILASDVYSVSEKSTAIQSIIEKIVYNKKEDILDIHYYL